MHERELSFKWDKGTSCPGNMKGEKRVAVVNERRGDGDILR